MVPKRSSTVATLSGKRGNEAEKCRKIELLESDAEHGHVLYLPHELQEIVFQHCLYTHSEQELWFGMAQINSLGRSMVESWVKNSYRTRQMQPLQTNLEAECRLKAGFPHHCSKAWKCGEISQSVVYRRIKQRDRTAFQDGLATVWFLRGTVGKDSQYATDCPLVSNFASFYEFDQKDPALVYFDVEIVHAQLYDRIVSELQEKFERPTRSMRIHRSLRYPFFTCAIAKQKSLQPVVRDDFVEIDLKAYKAGYVAPYRRILLGFDWREMWTKKLARERQLERLDLADKAKAAIIQIREQESFWSDYGCRRIGGEGPCCWPSSSAK